MLQQKLFLRPILELPTTANFPEMNDLLQELFPPFFEIKPCMSIREWPSVSAISSLLWAQNERTQEIVLRKEASWRRMLPTQPPPQLRHISVSFSQFSTQTQRCTLADDTVSRQPVNMGMIYDLVEEFTSEYETDHFHLHWHMFPQSASCVDFRHCVEGEALAREPKGWKNELSIHTLGFVSCLQTDDQHQGPQFRSLGCDLPELHRSDWS
jgi:hypothetical protein